MVEVAGMGVFTYRDVILFSVVILLIIFMFFWIIVFSNRVLGPIFRLIKQMEAFGTTGKLERIQFRKSDYLVELAVSYNKLAAHFEDAELKKNTKT